jgi:hypothetical protein
MHDTGVPAGRATGRALLESANRARAWLLRFSNLCEELDRPYPQEVTAAVDALTGWIASVERARAGGPPPQR